MDLFPIQHTCAIGADKDNMKKNLLQLIKELLNTCTYWHKAEEEREQLSSGAFLCGAGLRFQLHKFLGNFIIGSLRENPQDCESGLIHVNPAPEGAPASTASFVCYVSELHHCYPQNPVLPGKAVILHTDLELVGIGAIFIPQDAGKHTQIHLQCLGCKNKGASTWLEGCGKSQKTPFYRKPWSEGEK